MERVRTLDLRSKRAQEAAECNGGRGTRQLEGDAAIVEGSHVDLEHHGCEVADIDRDPRRRSSRLVLVRF